MRGGSHARALILSDQARRYLALQYRSYPTEFMGCMICEVQGNAVLVSRVAPAAVDPGHSPATAVPARPTGEAGAAYVGGNSRSRWCS